MAEKSADLLRPFLETGQRIFQGSEERERPLGRAFSEISQNRRYKKGETSVASSLSPSEEKSHQTNSAQRNLYCCCLLRSEFIFLRRNFENFNNLGSSAFLTWFLFTDGLEALKCLAIVFQLLGTPDRRSCRYRTNLGASLSQRIRM